MQFIIHHCLCAYRKLLSLVFAPANWFDWNRNLQWFSFVPFLRTWRQELDENTLTRDVCAFKMKVFIFILAILHYSELKFVAWNQTNITGNRTRSLSMRVFSLKSFAGGEKIRILNMWKFWWWWEFQGNSLAVLLSLIVRGVHVTEIPKRPFTSCFRIWTGQLRRSCVIGKASLLWRKEREDGTLWHLWTPP